MSGRPNCLTNNREEAFISANSSLHGRPENEGPGMTGHCFNIMGNGCGSQPVLPSPKKRNSSVNKHRGPRDEICEAHTDLQSLAMAVRGGQTACGGRENDDCAVVAIRSV